MANVTKCLSDVCLNVTINNIQKQITLHAISRTLYTDSALRLDKYIRSRRIVYQMFKKSSPELFKIKIAKLVADNKSNINLDDINATCCIIDKHPKDINLLSQIVHKTSKQNNSIDNNQLASLGSHIMLTLHYIRESDLALKIFMNPQYDNLFCAHLTQLILLDLLFESKRFKEVRQVYDKISNSITSNDRFIYSVSTLIAVSCYKENTRESLEYGLKFYENFLEKHASIGKITAAIGILALNQKAPEVAFRLMKSHKIIDAIHISIEIMALADLDELDGVEKHLEFIKNTSNPELQCLSKEIIPKIQNAIKRAGINSTSKISQLFNDVKKDGYIPESIFDHYLLSSIKKEQLSLYTFKDTNPENIKKLSKAQ